MLQKDLIWRLSTEGTLEQIRAVLGEVGPGAPATGGGSSITPPLAGLTPIARPPSLLASGGKLLRSRDSTIETHVLIPKTTPLELVQQLRDYWAQLRDHGLAEANPIKIFAAEDPSGAVTFIFRWKSPESQAKAQGLPEVVRAWASIRATSVAAQSFPSSNEVYQGFEYRGFPKQGGVELLRGKCTCRVKLNAFPEEFELDGQNGFVIMHRGPKFQQGDSSIMPVNILAHGADSPATNAMMASGSSAPIRVEQNTELPQFGIIRSRKSPLAGPNEPDFPATAMWVVHWRIHTPVGTVITDPNVPLVFGPTVVQHYPPVGTEFKSSTGPVKIFRADTGEEVGVLTPGELTAFDIVVTMDDQIPSVMDVPAKYHVDMFNKVVADPAQKISTDGLKDDYRVPASVRANLDSGN